MSYPKNHRLDNGYKLYQMGGTVKILFYDEEEIHAEIKNSTGDTELVSCILGFYRCTCDDWFNRWQIMPGAYFCKHIEDLHFEIAYRKFNGLEMVG